MEENLVVRFSRISREEEGLYIASQLQSSMTLEHCIHRKSKDNCGLDPRLSTEETVQRCCHLQTGEALHRG